MELSSLKLKKVLYFRREFVKPEKQTKKSVSYDVFTIFIAAKYSEIPCEVKMQCRDITL